MLVRASCHQRSARLAVFCLAVFAPLLASAVARGDESGTVQDRVAGLRSANASLASKSQQALLELYSLQTRLGLAERRVAGLETRQAEVEAQRESAKNQLDIARSGFQSAQSRLGARLRQLYIEGDVDPLAVLLGAQSLDEVLSALDGLDRLASQDKTIVTQLAQAKTALRAASARLAARQSELDALLADARTARAAIASDRDARAAYLASLRNQQALNRSQIDRLTAQAAAAGAQSQDLSGGGGSVPPAAPGHGTKMTVSSTGYCLKGHTATGIPTSHGVIAVDPSVIPLGTRMYVPGYGEGVAADTGSAVKGRMIDVWLSSCSQARAWGSRTVTITLH